MRNRRPSPDHAEAVARRLALLEAELDATRRTGATVVGDRVAHAVGPPTAAGWQPTGAEPAEEAEAAVAVERVEAVDVVEWIDLGERDAEVGPGRVPPHDPPMTVEQAPAELAAAIPVPGRHARRRRSGRLPAGWARGWGDRVRFTPAHVSVVATVLVVALGVTCWWLLAGRVEPMLSPVASPVKTLAPGTAASPSNAATPGASAGGTTQAAGVSGAPGAGTPAELVVDVAGKVRRPGIVVLPAGSRVVDAIEAAGGARRGVDLSSLNLARPLTDGEQILVGTGPAPQGPGGGTASGGQAGGTPPGTTLVNINLATLDQLDTLPGVGPVTAQAIVDWRTRHGGFTAVDDLLEVDGIGDATLQKLAPLVTL